MGRFQEFWGVCGDPFRAGPSQFIATPVHTEAVARIVHAVEAGDPSIELRAPAGLGKTTVLAHATETLRGPRRKVLRVRGDEDLTGAVLDAIGARPPLRGDRGAMWRGLVEAARVIRLQKLGLVILVDDVRRGDSETRADLARLAHLDPHPDSRIAVVTTGRDDTSPEHDAWSLSIRLVPLTRSETAAYLKAKLQAAGRAEPVFTDRAMTRLHAVSAGVPRGLDRLASLAMIAGAVRGLEILTPDVIDGVASECVSPAAA